MPTETKACKNIGFCLGAIGPCFCCNKGHEGDPHCISEGNPQCPDYKGGLAFGLEEIERLELHVIFN